MAAAIALGAMLAHAAAPELLQPAAAASSSIARTTRLMLTPAEPELLRTRTVQPDAGVLLDLAEKMSGTSADTSVRISFFDDASLVVELDSARRTGSGDSIVLTGRVPGVARSAATFIVKGAKVVGNVQVAERVYQLRFREVAEVAGENYFGANVIHEAREIDPTLFRDHDKNYAAFMSTEEQRARKPSGRAGIQAQSDEFARDDGSIVDMLIAYTSTSRASAGGTAAIVAQIELAVSEANLAYLNSGIGHRLRLLKTLEVDYVETGSSSTDLGRLRSRTDKFLDEVHAYRAAYGADIVSLIVERMDDACGIGYLMSNVTTTFAASAFNVVARGCATGNYTLAHEVGHNMGLRHDVFMDTGITPFADAHGYVDTTARFRTVMAYNDACTTKGFNCRRVPNFSNPDVLIDSVPAGLTASANASRVLNVTRNTAANFVQAADFSNGAPVTFIKSAYVGTEGTSVVVTVERIPGPTGAASVQYSTVGVTATPGQDFTAVSGTLNWASGDFSPKTITITLLQDSVVEATETFNVVLSNVTGATLGTSVATVTILDDEAGVFPPGCVVPASWTNNTGDSSLGWTVATDSAGEGRCSLRSGAIGDRASSRIAVTGNYLAGTVRFSRRVSTENTFDCLRFTIDGVQQNVGGQCSETGGIGASGEVPWSAVELPVSAGRHTFTWSYEKDGNAIEGEDAVWIDDVQLPPESSLLTVVKSGNGSGTVTSVPAGIDCGNTCLQVLPPSNVVTLSAVAAGGDTFSGWSGGCSGTGPCTISMNTSKVVIATFSAPVGSKPLDYSDMWWVGDAENGWGMSISQHSPSNIQFNAFYVYEANRAPTWFVMSGGTWNANFTSFTGLLYRPTGPPIPDFDSTKVVVGASVGTATLTFTSATTMTVTYTINGISGTKNMVRQPFGGIAETQQLRVNDIWWGGPSQSGWGVSIAQQFNALFSVWYTYGLFNLPTWIVVPSGTWNGNTYSGTMYATTGAPWLGVPYNPATLTVMPVGTMTFSFTPDANGLTSSNATMTYVFTAGNFAGTAQTKTITRQGF
ncbi:MAG: reprolysin-like metallopeptidase [Betaproteobacteria bacterium]